MLGFRGEDSAVRGEDLGFRRDLVLAFVGFRVFVARLLGFRRESFGLCLGGFWAFVGEEAFGLSWGGFGHRGDSGFCGDSGFRGGVGFGLSWRGIRGGEAFALSRRNFRAFAGRASSFGGRLLGEGFGLWWEDFGLGEDLGFVGVRAFVGRNSGLRIGFTNLRLRAAP